MGPDIIGMTTGTRQGSKALKDGWTIRTVLDDHSRKIFWRKQSPRGSLIKWHRELKEYLLTEPLIINYSHIISFNLLSFLHSIKIIINESYR